jgi:hypothetical protein
MPQPQLIRLYISTTHKWKKAQETDMFIALQGTIYGTSMYSSIDADNTRGGILDAPNPDSDADVVGHDDLKGVTSQHENK